MNKKKISPLTPQQMQKVTEEIIRELGVSINLVLKEYFPGSAFALLIFPHRTPCVSNYISNAERGSTIEALESVVKKLKATKTVPSEIKKRVMSKFWEEYKTKVLPKTAPSIQVSECQMAFYGGATAIIGEILRFGEEKTPEDEAIQMMQDLLDEVEEFKTLITATPTGQTI